MLYLMEYQLNRSNCTFMELKSLSNSRTNFSSRRSNCTFMELKSKKIGNSIRMLRRF